MGFITGIKTLRTYARQGDTVYVLGLRGFPDVQGGVETHSENLYPLVAKSNMRVICATRSEFHNPAITEWKGVHFLPIWAPRSRFLEAFVHSLLAVLCAAVIRPSVVHIHAIGPALVTPLVRLFGLPVVVTHHGPDYDREKWNKMAKTVLRIGEWAGMKFATERIVISPVIEEWVERRYQRSSNLIPNGVPIPSLDSTQETLASYELEKGNYVLLVSRIVPEKRHFDLMESFEQLTPGKYKLVLVGGADHPDDYELAVQERARANPDIIMTGVLQGRNLKEIYEHAAVFVLPSSHEGLPISLLEALSFGLRCVASDIPANLAVGMPASNYFPLGSITDLVAVLDRKLSMEWTPAHRQETRAWVSSHFNWQDIAKTTTEVYGRAIH